MLCTYDVVELMIYTLQYFGWVLHLQESVLLPAMRLISLGLMFTSVQARVFFRIDKL